MCLVTNTWQYNNLRENMMICSNRSQGMSLIRLLQYKTHATNTDTKVGNWLHWKWFKWKKMCTCDARLRISPSLRCNSAGVGNMSAAICAASAATKAQGELGQQWLQVHRIISSSIQLPKLTSSSKVFLLHNSITTNSGTFFFLMGLYITRIHLQK